MLLWRCPEAVRIPIFDWILEPFDTYVVYVKNNRDLFILKQWYTLLLQVIDQPTGKYMTAVVRN